MTAQELFGTTTDMFSQVAPYSSGMFSFVWNPIGKIVFGLLLGIGIFVLIVKTVKFAFFH